MLNDRKDNYLFIFVVSVCCIDYSYEDYKWYKIDTGHKEINTWPVATMS